MKEKTLKIVSTFFFFFLSFFRRKDYRLFFYRFHPRIFLTLIFVLFEFNFLLTLFLQTKQMQVRFVTITPQTEFHPIQNIMLSKQTFPTVYKSHQFFFFSLFLYITEFFIFVYIRFSFKFLSSQYILLYCFENYFHLSDITFIVSAFYYFVIFTTLYNNRLIFTLTRVGSYQLNITNNKLKKNHKNKDIV